MIKQIYWILGLLLLSGACSTTKIDSQPTSITAAQQSISDLGLESQYPFEHHFIDVPQGRMHYIDEGQGNPVVTLHGNPSWSFLYRHFISGLSDVARVIAPDYIGFGLSEKPVRTDAYSIEKHVQDIESLLEQLDLHNVTLVLHDWGGPIGLIAASRQSDRIQSLVIMNTFGFYPPLPSMDADNVSLPLPLRMMRAPLIGNLMVRKMGMFERNVMRMATFKKDKYDEVKQAYRGVFQSAKERGGVDAFPRLIPDSVDHPSAQLIVNEAEPYLAQFKGEVSLFWGLQDPFLEQEMIAEWQQRLPQATVHKIEHAGHYLQEDAHEEIVPLIRSMLVGDTLEDQ